MSQIIKIKSYPTNGFIIVSRQLMFDESLIIILFVFQIYYEQLKKVLQR